ncbi:endochitinase EP3-like [Cornus florida]|uniref:endochitinase EP3-like n=1 Tax=Cornus florida TaxID=4283 RepID=UPI00289AC09F|nr:endochitinase EP3-like [Cornus florida]
MAIAFNLEKASLITVILAGILAGYLPESVVGDCSCASYQCCSYQGECDTGNAFCGFGCQAGPCYKNDIVVADVVTEDFFNGIVNQAGTGNCPGVCLYTREAFLEAADLYPEFGTTGPDNAARKFSLHEIAAFFAHATYETDHFCNIFEVPVSNSMDYCNTNYIQQYPLAPKKGYYDGLMNPNIASNVSVTFKTALGYWMTKIHIPNVIELGFGETIKIIRPQDCTGHSDHPTDAVIALDAYFKEYCKQFGVDPDYDLDC